VKHLEDLRVHYDHTVRNAEGGVVQFLYGEDGLDVIRSQLIAGSDQQLSLLARNHPPLSFAYQLNAAAIQRYGLNTTAAPVLHRRMHAARRAAAGEAPCEVGMRVRSRVAAGAPDGGAAVEGVVVKVRPGPLYDVRFGDGDAATKVKRIPAADVKALLPDPVCRKPLPPPRPPPPCVWAGAGLHSRNEC
jgi:hypothetical protein